MAAAVVDIGAALRQPPPLQRNTSSSSGRSHPHTHMSGLTATANNNNDLLLLASTATNCNSSRHYGPKSAVVDTNNNDDDVDSSTTTLTATASCAMSVLTTVERSVLRMLAFVFYQLDREQAKFCASAILRGYFQLQTQLPGYAVASLERVAASVIALSDAQFTTFWVSLLEKELESSSFAAVTSSSRSPSSSPPLRNSAASELLVLSSSSSTQPPDARITIQSFDPSELRHVRREQTLLRRLYQPIYCTIRSLFAAQRAVSNATHNPTTQTPCTSPIDYDDDSHFQPIVVAKRRQSRATRFVLDDSDGLDWRAADTGESVSASMSDDDDVSIDSSSDHDDDDDSTNAMGDDDVFEPGWAVEYMEQEASSVSSALSRRMRQMMHTSIPLNLFRVTVTYNNSTTSDMCADADADGFVGIVSPESFPPTPITREVQTRRMNCYTASVLDHTTLALRLLEANSYSRTYQQLR